MRFRFPLEMARFMSSYHQICENQLNVDYYVIDTSFFTYDDIIRGKFCSTNVIDGGIIRVGFCFFCLS